MIYCVTQPMEKYQVNVSGFTVGPWSRYEKRPELFAALSFFSPILYQWEQGSPVPTQERFTGPDLEYEKALDRLLGMPLASDMTVFELLSQHATTPWEFRRKFLEGKPNWLPTDFRYPEPHIRMILNARVCSWASSMPYASLASDWEDTFLSDEQAVKENAYGLYSTVHKRR